MNLTKVSRYISYLLRHNPESAGLKLDNHGWCNSKDLIKVLKEKYPGFKSEMLDEIVNTDEKKRYSFDKYKMRIRANQGHSINVDADLKEAIPPDILYHGTSIKYVYSIYKEGIKHMSRLYVHLSKDIDTAVKVGKRHGGPVVLEIDCRSMISDGYKFYLSENSVWLTKIVPSKYIKIVNEV